MQLFKNKKLKEALFISLVFFIIEFIVVLFHEVWRDEIEPWSITFNSHSFSELFYNTRYEGFPKLWFVIQYLLQKFTGNIIYLQYLHVFIAALSVYVFCFYSPFNYIKNILFCSGYFFAYEYSIITRYYAIELLLLFLCVGLFLRYNSKYFLLISFLLFLLLQDSVFAVIIALPFYCFIVIRLKETKSLKPKIFILSLLLILSGIIISVITMKPPPDSGVVVGWAIDFNTRYAMKVFSTITESYFPFPEFKRQFWNTSLFDYSEYRDKIMCCLSVLFLAAITFIYRSNKLVLLLFFSGTFGLLLFFYTKNLGWVRHHGQLYIMFVLCSLIFFHDEKKKQKSDASKNGFRFLFTKYFMITILSFQIIPAFFAIVTDLKYPFSTSMATSKYLKSNSLDTLKFIGDRYTQTTSLAGLLDKEIYSPRTHKWDKYSIYDTTRIIHDTSQQQIIDEVEMISHKINEKVVVILDYPISNKPDNWNFLKNFDSGIVTDEDFFIYLISPKAIK